MFDAPVAGHGTRVGVSSGARGLRPVRTLVLAPFFGVDSPNNRPRAMAEVLAEFGPVDVVTTSFDHARKAYKPPEQWDAARRIVHIPTPAYVRNVSARRFWSHVVFARRALRFVAAHAADYDVVYATAPLSPLGAGAFARVPGALRILDVVDIWPDVLPFPSTVRRVGRPAFAVGTSLCATACRRADILLAVSDSFLDEGRRWFRGGDGRARRFYIGNPRLPTDAAALPSGTFPGVVPPQPGRRRIAYVGNIGALYDFETLLDVLSTPAMRATYELDVIGLGDRDAWLRAELARRGIAHRHWGVVSAPEALGPILAGCNAGFNGYRNTSAAFSYKATTYLAAGIPLVNSMGGDLAAIVREHGVGANYIEGDATSLRRALDALAAEDQAALRARCRVFFDRELDATRVAAQVRDFLAVVLTEHRLRRSRA